jgi:3-hydroxyisobutyrate dehydrogenase
VSVRVGWIGAGIMGAPMAGHVLAAGHEVSVFSRRQVSAAGLLDAGATWAPTPAAAADGADVVITMVGLPADVQEVWLGEDGVLAGARRGAVVVDMTTSDPALAAQLDGAAAGLGVLALDAPVTGGEAGAQAATLRIMCGGRPEAFDAARPVLELLGTPRLLGEAGAGQHAKLVNQIAISSGMVALCEALVYGAGAGLDLEQVLDLIGGGAAGSWSMEHYGPKILAGDLAPGFKVDHFVKDLGLALAQARRMRLALPGLALAEQLYAAVQARDLGGEGIQALAVVLADLSRVRLER